MSVITIENVRDFPAEARGAFVTVGNFDGVHRGHQRLLGRLRAKADAAGVPAACNIGPNPTFGEQVRKVEAHLIDFQGELYGKTIEIDFLERLRGTLKFAGLDALLAQIQADVGETRRIASGGAR
jgi:FAD synthase